MRVQSQGSGIEKLDVASPNYCWGSAGSRGASLMGGREGRAPKIWWCWGSRGRRRLEIKEAAFVDNCREVRIACLV